MEDICRNETSWRLEYGKKNQGEVRSVKIIDLRKYVHYNVIYKLFGGTGAWIRSIIK